VLGKSPRLRWGLGEESLQDHRFRGSRQSRGFMQEHFPTIARLRAENFLNKQTFCYFSWEKKRRKLLCFSEEYRDTIRTLCNSVQKKGRKVTRPRQKRVRIADAPSDLPKSLHIDPHNSPFGSLRPTTTPHNPIQRSTCLLKW
jgi:hypothetical protein